jgi:hypothetical protein
LAPAAEDECGIDPAQGQNTPAKTGFRAPSYIDFRNGAGEFADMVDCARSQLISGPHEGSLA